MLPQHLTRPQVALVRTNLLICDQLAPRARMRPGRTGSQLQQVMRAHNALSVRESKPLHD